jgi:hypothetical protein
MDVKMDEFVDGQGTKLSAPSKPPPFQNARYREPDVRSHKGNPLIEALPPSLDDKDSMSLLLTLPEYQEADREKPTYIREQYILDVTTALFVPLTVHTKLYRRFARLIPAGYKGRNPVLKDFYRENSAASAQFAEDSNRGCVEERPPTMATPGVTAQPQTWSPALGFSVVGLPGVGKSRSIYEVLTLFQQRIEHTNYMGVEWSFRQIPWLIVQCPADGSTREMCLAFFLAMDSLLGTTYWQSHGYCGKPTATKGVLRPNMAHVAGLHGLGVLVIDEIQRINTAASGGRDEMLNFFAQLVDTMKVPVVLVGTLEALPILSGKLHVARRAAGQGDHVWDRLAENDADWTLLTNALWRYQYTRTPTPITDALRHALYNESAGITDIAIKLYMLAQCLAMNSTRERITAKSFTEVAHAYLRMARPIVQAIRKGDKRAMSRYSDVRPKHMEWIIEDIADAIEIIGKMGDERRNAEETRHTSAPQTAQPVGSEQEDAALRGSEPDNAAVPGDEPVLFKAVERGSKTTAKGSRSMTGKSRSGPKKKPAAPGGLLEAAERGHSAGISHYAALAQGGFIKSATEFQ